MRNLLLTILVAAAAAGQAPQGLEIRNFQYDASRRTLDYDVVNTTAQRITFFELLVMAGDREASRSTFSTTIEGPAAATDRRRAADPGGMQHIQSVYNGDTAAPRVMVNAVIFEDGRAMGDSKTLDRVFAQRKISADEYQRWLPRLRALRDSRDVYGDARALYDAVSAAGYEEDRASFDRDDDAGAEAANIRRNVQALARAVAKKPETARDRIDSFLKSAELQVRMSVRN